MGQHCCGPRDHTHKPKLYEKLKNPAEAEAIKKKIGEEFDKANTTHVEFLGFTELKAITIKAHTDNHLEPLPKEEEIKKILKVGDNKDFKLNKQQYIDLVWAHIQLVANEQEKADKEAAEKLKSTTKSKETTTHTTAGATNTGTGTTTTVKQTVTTN